MTAQDNHPSSTTPAPDLGNTFHAKYELLAELGAGGMGVVYQARDRSNNKLVAVKTIRMGISGSAKSRFLVEAQVLQKLRHPHIVALLDFNFSQPLPYMVLEYVNGKTLAQLFAEEGQLDADRIVSIFPQACAALAYAHAQGILHRDIKPGNFLITKKENGDEHLYLMDFGIAKVVSDQTIEVQKLTSTGDIIGTPTYISPEQSKAEQIDERSDLYSLGCVMYEALTGSPPFISDSLLGVVIQHRQAQPLSIREASMGRTVDPRLNMIVDKLLEKDSVMRFQSANDLQKALLDVRTAARTEKHLALTPEGKKSAPRKALNPTVATLAVGLLIFALFAFWEWIQNNKLVQSEPKPTALTSNELPASVTSTADKVENDADKNDSKMIRSYRASLQENVTNKSSRIIIGENTIYTVTDEDLALLKSDENLHELRIRGEANKNGLANTNPLKLETLSALPLRILQIVDVPVADWQTLRKFNHLEILWIRQKKLEQPLISISSGLKNLTYLRLDGACATNVDLRILAGLKKLQVLILPNGAATEDLLSEMRHQLPGCVIIAGRDTEPGTFKRLVQQGNHMVSDPTLLLAGLARYQLALQLAARDPLATRTEKIEVLVASIERANTAFESAPGNERGEFLAYATANIKNACDLAGNDKHYGPITQSVLAQVYKLYGDYQQSYSRLKSATTHREKAFSIGQRAAAQFDAADPQKESRDQAWQWHRLKNLRLLVEIELQRKNSEHAEAIFQDQLEPLATKISSIGVCSPDAKKLLSEVRAELGRN